MRCGLALALLCFARFTSANFYESLGVAPDSDEGAIKKAYRKLSLKYHPGAFSMSSKGEEEQVSGFSASQLVLRHLPLSHLFCARRQEPWRRVRAEAV